MTAPNKSPLPDPLPSGPALRNDPSVDNTRVPAVAVPTLPAEDLRGDVRDASTRSSKPSPPRMWRDTLRQSPPRTPWSLSTRCSGPSRLATGLRRARTWYASARDPGTGGQQGDPDRPAAPPDGNEAQAHRYLREDIPGHVEGLHTRGGAPLHQSTGRGRQGAGPGSRRPRPDFCRLRRRDGAIRRAHALTPRAPAHGHALERKWRRGHAHLERSDRL